MKSLLRIIIIFACFSVAVFGQEVDSLLVEPTYYFEEITVTASRTLQPIYQIPYAVGILGAHAIQKARPGISLEEVLRQQPGLAVNNRTNLAQGDRISIRGLGSRAAFGVRGIRIFLDDIPMTFADGQSQLNNLELLSVAEIEVMRGPSSSLYGNASGGVINMRSDFPDAGHFYFEPGFVYGSFNLRKWWTKLGGGFGKHAFAVNLAGLDYDGFRDHAFSHSNSANVTWRSRLSTNLNLQAVMSYVNAPYLYNPSSLNKSDAQSRPESTRAFVKQQGAAKQVEQGQGGITLLFDKNAHAFRTSLYGIGRTLLNPIPGQIIELHRQAGGFRSVYSRRLSGRLSRWTTGADLEMQRDRRQEFDNRGLADEVIGTVKDAGIFALVEYGDKLLDQDEDVNGVGVFSEIEMMLLPGLQLTGGLRYDHYRFTATDHLRAQGIDHSGERKMARLSPMLGVTYRIRPYLAVYGNFTTGFQTPTTNELSNQAGYVGGFNPVLQPEKMRNLEVGVKGAWPSNNLQFQTAFFLLNVHDMLIAYQIPEVATDEEYYRNAGKASNLGIEFFCKWRLSEALSTTLSYTFMNFEFKDYAVDSDSGLIQLRGNRLPGVPPHHLYFDVHYDHQHGWYGSFDLQWWSAVFSNDFNGAAPGASGPPSMYINDGYWLTDIRIGLQRQFGLVGFDLFLGLKNLFDQRYNGSIVSNAFGGRFFEPAPGRNWYNGIRLFVSF